MAVEVGAGQGTDRTGLGDVLHVDVREKRPREGLLQVLSLEEEAATCAYACGHVAVSPSASTCVRTETTATPLTPARHRRLQREHLAMPSYQIL